jgi:hypothetical protein
MFTKLKNAWKALTSGPSLHEVWKSRDWSHDCKERGCVNSSPETGLAKESKGETTVNDQSR